ncbi:MAG: FkbM family methyltransferase [Ferruginibacter sp.]
MEDGWRERIQDVIDCPDNRYIRRHPDAGRIKNGTQVMHNGILITLGGYYGDPIVQMLSLNKGVHEPQEEYAFGEVLKEIPEGATMLEFGAYWSFYSIWFSKTVKDAKNFLVEPDAFNMLYGINNFRINHIQGSFTNAFIGKVSDTTGSTAVLNVDDYVTANTIEFIDLLHSDIQGFEYDMLLGATKTIAEHKIKYVFISTHGNKVHNDCLNFLALNDFTILCSANEQDTYSLDGLIVARSNHFKGIESIKISLKSKTQLSKDL